MTKFNCGILVLCAQWASGAGHSWPDLEFLLGPLPASLPVPALWPVYAEKRLWCVITRLFWHTDVSGSAAFCSLTERELCWLRWYSWNSGLVMFVTLWLIMTLRSVSDECTAKLPVSEVKFSRKSKKEQWLTLSWGSWADETWRTLPSAELGLQPQFRILSGLRIWWAHLRSASCPPPFFFFLPSFLIQTHFYDSRQLSLWKLPCNTHWSVALPGAETQRWVADSGFIFHLAFLEDSFWFLWGNGWQTQMRRKEKLCLFHDKVFIP